MKADARNPHRTGNISIRYARRMPLLVFLVLFLVSVLSAENRAAAQPASGTAENSPVDPVEAKADFLFKKPGHYFGLRAGWIFPTADSDLFDMVTEELTLEKSDFQAWVLGIDLGFNLFERFDLIFRFDYSDSSSTSEFRNYVDQQGLPITQKTGFLQSSLTAGIKYLFVPRGRGVGHYAWIPNRFVPFVEAGAGGLKYRFKQTGDFVDYMTMEIFRARLESSGWTPVLYLGGGVDIRLYRSTYVTMDLRYSWAEDDLSNSFTGFDPIDLSGFRTTAGISFHY